MIKILVLAVVACAFILVFHENLGFQETNVKDPDAPVPEFPLPFMALTPDGFAPDKLAKQLESAEVKERLGAVKALYFLKWNATAAIPALTKSLNDPDAEVRAMAVGCFYFLDVTPESGVVPILEDIILNDKSDKVRGSSACTLCRLSHDKNLNKNMGVVFFRALDDKDKYVRVHAATALAIMGHESARALQILAGFLDAHDDKLRTQIVWSFSDVGQSALPILRESLLHKNPRVRATAAESLIGVIKRMQSRKQELPEDLVLSLTHALEDSDSRVILCAARALTIIGPKANPAISRMIKLLDHGDPVVRYTAAIDLGDFGPAAKAAVPKLEHGLTDNDWRMRGSAGYALAGILGKKSIPFLEKALADPEWRVSRPASEILKRLKSEP